MKKQGLYILLLVTGLFAAFTVGFFLGRNSSPNELHINPLTLAVPTTVPETTAAPSVTFPIDLNIAGKEELMLIPGVGEVTAQRIIAYREKNGPFLTLDELGNISGIGKTRLEELKDYLCIGGQMP